MLRSASVVERREPVHSVSRDDSERLCVRFLFRELRRVGLGLRDVRFGELALRGYVAHREPLRLSVFLHAADHEHRIRLAKNDGARFRGEQTLGEADGGFGALKDFRRHRTRIELAPQHVGRRLTREPHADDDESETSRFLHAGVSGEVPELRDADGFGGDGRGRDDRQRLRSLELPTVFGIAVARSGVRFIGPAG